ncbi:hypothetical protein SOVF_087460 [Spinacia oleracea]|nr:hypothetical protein SOVF_087460 [Spinacia oleracea]
MKAMMEDDQIDGDGDEIDEGDDAGIEDEEDLIVMLRRRLLGQKWKKARVELLSLWKWLNPGVRVYRKMRK